MFLKLMKPTVWVLKLDWSTITIRVICRIWELHPQVTKNISYFNKNLLLPKLIYFFLLYIYIFTMIAIYNSHNGLLIALIKPLPPKTLKNYNYNLENFNHNLKPNITSNLFCLISINNFSISKSITLLWSSNNSTRLYIWEVVLNMNKIGWASFHIATLFNKSLLST